MHEHGVGLPVDLFLAKRFYDSAADTSAEAKLPSSIALTVLQVR
jgi:SEL1 protein